jgi:ABC-type spermidine/putrescine transport system permease subunit II
MVRAARREERQQLDLAQAAKTLLDECRMVLPGIQALFGFQLIVVFNERFARDLERFDQLLHLAAISLIAIAVALVMTPAAYHRSRGSREVTDTFIHICSALLLASMVILAIGLSLDFQLIAKLVIGDERISILCGVALFSLLLALWLVFPRLRGVHQRLAAVREQAGHR